MKNKIYEIGRSLLEMLGVLAVVGILSVGALVSYNYAVNKYKANETLDEISKRHIVLMMQNTQGKTLDMKEFAPTTSLGYPVDVALLKDEIKGYKISLSKVPSGVCREIVMSNYPATLLVNGGGGGIPSLCAKENVLEFEFNVDEGWCDRMDEHGNCCDKHGKCCPPDKPLINSSNQCVSCLGSQSIHLGADNIYTCTRCDNRKPVNYYCALACPAGKIKDDSGNCRTCDDVAQFYIDKNDENIETALACPYLTVSTDFDKVIVRHCNMSNNVFAVHDYAYTCHKCDNREAIKLTETGVLCAKKCLDNQVMDVNGNCHTCDHMAQYYINKTNDNIIRAKSCSKLALRNINNAVLAQHCDLNAQSLDVTGYLETCNKCDNRNLQGTNCVLK